MADPQEEIVKRYVEKAAQLRATEDVEKHLQEVIKKAKFRIQMYANGVETDKLKEHIEDLDWWSRAVKIGAAVGVGLAVGALAGPAVIGFLGKTGAMAWGSTTTGISAGTLAWLTVKGGTMVIGGQIQKHTSATGTAPGTSALGLLFEDSYEKEYKRHLADIKFQMLNWTDTGLVPLILADEFEFLMTLENTYRRAALMEGVPRAKAERAKTKFCLDFWTKLEKTLQDELKVKAYAQKAEQLKAELEKLKIQLDRAAAASPAGGK